MSKKSLKVDDILDLVTDDRVVDVLAARLASDDRVIDSLAIRLTTIFSPIMEALFNKLADNFLAKLEVMVEKVSKEFLTKSCEPLYQRMSSLEDENTRLKAQLEENERNTRLNNLVVHGLPEAPWTGESMGESNSKPTYFQLRHAAIHESLDFFTTRLQMPVTEADISFAFRIPNKVKGAPRPLVVGFVGRRIRDTIFASRGSLKSPHGSKSSSIYINDHLTRTNSLIFAKTRGLLRDQRIHSTWTSGGNILIRRSDSSTEKPIKITSLQQLEDLLPSSTAMASFSASDPVE